MLLTDFHVIGVGLAPVKAQAPMMVDADAALALALAARRHETIAGRVAANGPLDVGS